MIAYHVDKSSMLIPGQELNIFSNVKLDKLFNNYDNSFSNHGLQYLNQYTDCSIWELCLEFVRLNHFPQFPSRLQSFFGVENLEDAIFWKGYFSHYVDSKINICKIDCSNSFKFDARWITKPPVLESNNNNFNFTNKSIAKMLQYSYKYWNQEKTENPLFELLIVPPVKVLEII